jgi:hypothetical protein
MSLNDYKMVKVTWHDAHSISDGWAYEDEIDDDEPFSVVHIGYLLPVGKGGKRGHVSLAFGMTEDEALDTRMHIPQKMVIKVEELEIGAERMGRPAGVSKQGRAKGSGRGRTTR